MTSKLNPYLNFDGNAREAMDLYQRVLGGDLERTTFAEAGFGEGDDAERVMHSQLVTPAGFTLMVSDVMTSMGHEPFSPSMSISISGDDETEIRGYWDGLAAGGTVDLPLEKAPWGDTFGALKDEFGVSWMFNIAGS